MTAETFDILVRGELGPMITDELDGFAVVSSGAGRTRLRGVVPDQARLVGVARPVAGIQRRDRSGHTRARSDHVTGVEQAQLARLGDRRAPVGDAELAVDVRRVRLQGVDRHEDLLRQFGTRGVAGQVAEDLQLAIGERLGELGVRVGRLHGSPSRENRRREPSSKRCELLDQAEHGTVALDEDLDEPLDLCSVERRVDEPEGGSVVPSSSASQADRISRRMPPRGPSASSTSAVAASNRLADSRSRRASDAATVSNATAAVDGIVPA